MCRTTCLVHGSSRLHPPILVESIRLAAPLVPNPLHALLYHFGDCAHHQAGFVIFAQLALLSLFIILIFPILPIVRTCKITQTVSDSNQPLRKRLPGSQDVYRTISACIISSCSCRTAALASSTRFLAPAVSLPT